jgi:protoporphyrinogen/coproporphyrinogen III oxidase
VKVVVVGGGIAGLAAARKLEALVPEAEIVLVEGSERLGGKLLTEREDGFVVEGGADSFLSRKPRGIGLAEELGLADELVGRRPENARTFVRHEDGLYPLPEGLTGMIPTNLEALARSTLLSEEGKQRLAAEPDLPAAPAGADESIASFVSRRLGREAYERLVEPLMTGIYGGDGEQLSLQATFPNLRALELEHGSVLRGLGAQSAPPSGYPPFVSFRRGMQTLAERLAARLEGTHVLRGAVADGVDFRDGSYAVAGRHFGEFDADGLVLAVPAFAVAKLLAALDPELSRFHAEIPLASSAIVTLAYRREDVSHALDGYGYVVPRVEHPDVLACTWSSSKWERRAPAKRVLLRVYLGRYGERDVSRLTKDALVALARDEVRLLEIEAEPTFVRIHRWRYGMPQYVLGHPERLERIDAALERHPGLALAGAAYRGVGIPDCIYSGEEAARSLARALAGVSG